MEENRNIAITTEGISSFLYGYGAEDISSSTTDVFFGLRGSRYVISLLHLPTVCLEKAFLLAGKDVHRVEETLDRINRTSMSVRARSDENHRIVVFQEAILVKTMDHFTSVFNESLDAIDSAEAVLVGLTSE